MVRADAEAAGRTAFEGGKPCAPALNSGFIADACASATPTAELLSAWLAGWTAANLAAPVREDL